MGGGPGSLGGVMTYQHFLFDLDDTLLDFRASERASFAQTMAVLGLADGADALYLDYRRESAALWTEFEQGKVSKEFLRVERFRRAFRRHGLDGDPCTASAFYLDILPETVILIDGATELCEALAGIGALGVVTNGIDAVQRRRIQKAGLSPYMSFVVSSDTCGFAKPDPRIFEVAAGVFGSFRKPAAIMIGDRLDSDIAGATQFGIDSCWFNPSGSAAGGLYSPTFAVSHLDAMRDRLCP